MKIKEIYFEQVRNLGNYETRRIGMTAIVEDNESIRAAVNDLADLVISQLCIERK